MDTGYLRVDERTDAISSLEHCAEITKQLAIKPVEWKWCILAMHNALQAILVCTLSGSAGLGALTDKSAGEWLSWYEDDKKGMKCNPPKEYLADLPTLYKRAKRPERMGEFGGKPINTSTQTDSNIKLLNGLRRNFAHYTPKGWSIQLLGLPSMILAACDVIELLLPHPANSLRTSATQCSEIERALAIIREQMALTSKLYTKLADVTQEG